MSHPNFRLDLVDVVFETAHSRAIVVIGTIENGVEDDFWAECQNVRLGLQAAKRQQRGGDHERPRRKALLTAPRSAAEAAPVTLPCAKWHSGPGGGGV